MKVLDLRSSFSTHPCQGSNSGDFKSVDEVVRFYKLPNQKTKTSKDKVNL